jgi:pimeloyl-ACP methyl ester carboxylesterase
MRIADHPSAAKALWAATKLAATFSSRLAGRIAYELWFTPWTVDPGERGRAKQAEWLSPTHPVYFGTAAGRIAGFEAGSGPTVLLVHGWGERAASLGAFIRPLTEAGYRVVGIDAPDHGDSAPAEANVYVVGDTIRQVVDQLGGVTAVIAHSIGGHATMYALKSGLKVDSVVLLAPSSRLQTAFARFQELLGLPPRGMTGLKRALERRFGTVIWNEMNGDELVRDLDVPALIVHDRDDPQVPLADSELVVAAWPDARLITTESLGHGRILRDEEVVAQALAFVHGHSRVAETELEDAIR